MKTRIILSIIIVYTSLQAIASSAFTEKDTCKAINCHFTVKTINASTNGVYIVWQLSSVENIKDIVVYRKNPDKDKFLKLKTKLSYYSENDTTYALLRDEEITAVTWYQYFLEPYNFCDNPWQLSDTVTVATIAKDEIPFPQALSVSGVPERRSLKISWKYNTTVPISRTMLYRSETAQGQFALCATIPGDATTFEDVVNRANENYFYFAVAETPFGKSIPSAVSFGLFQGTDVPSTPPKPVVTSQGDDVMISWQQGESFVIGYHVFRQSGASEAWENISGLIRENQFRDTSRKMPLRTYNYAIRAVSDGYYDSELSVSASIRTGEGLLAAPQQLNVLNKEKQYLFVWEPVSKASPWVEKCILRLTYPNGTTRINEISAQANSYLLENTGSLELATLQYVSVYGGESEEAVFSLPENTVNVMVPEGVYAEKNKNGVTVNWNRIVGMEGGEFQILRQWEGHQPAVLGSTKENSFVDTTVETGKTYGYQIQYIDEHGNAGVESEMVIVVFQ